MPPHVDPTSHYHHPELSQDQAEELGRLVEAAAAIIKASCATLKFGATGSHPDFDSSNREAMLGAIAAVRRASAAVSRCGALDQPPVLVAVNGRSKRFSS